MSPMSSAGAYRNDNLNKIRKQTLIDINSIESNINRLFQKIERTLYSSILLFKALRLRILRTGGDLKCLPLSLKVLLSSFFFLLSPHWGDLTFLLFRTFILCPFATDTDIITLYYNNHSPTLYPP